jgi:hypothetical protein
MPGQQPIRTPVPVTDIAVTTAGSIRDEVVKETLGVPAASVTSADVNNTVTQLGYDAFYRVTEEAKWYSEVSVRDGQPDPIGSELPDIWNELFRAEWIVRAMRRFRSPQSAQAFTAQYLVPLQQRIADHYTADWNSPTVLAIDTVTPGDLRRSALAYLVRQRTPFFPPIDEVDRVVRDEFVKLWNECSWEFKKRVVCLLITTGGDVLSETNIVFDGMASEKFWIRTEGGSVFPVCWVDASRFAERLARLVETKGRPRYFYDLDHGTEKKVVLLPRPDKNYEAFAVIFIAAPNFLNQDDTDGISNLPVEFRTNLRDFVIAKLMSKGGREDVDAARELFRVAREERERFAQAWDDKGASRSQAQSQIQREWVNSLTSRSFTEIIGSLG